MSTWRKASLKWVHGDILKPNFMNWKISRYRHLVCVFAKDLKFSYKNLGVSKPAKITTEHRLNLTLSWKIMIGVLERDFFLIFVDESLVNRNTMNSYGWTKQGMPERLVIKPWDFRMSFIVAHSAEGVEVLWVQRPSSIKKSIWNLSNSWWLGRKTNLK